MDTTTIGIILFFILLGILGQMLPKKVKKTLSIIFVAIGLVIWLISIIIGFS